MKLAVIVPVLNEAGQLPSALSLLRALIDVDSQSVLIVVDGGSSDNSRAVAKTYAHAVIDAPRGRATQMNAGAWRAAAQGADLFCFVHADTQLPATAFAAMRQAIADGALWGRFDVTIRAEPELPAAPLLPMIATMMNHRSRLSGIATGDQAIFVKAKTFAAVAGYPAQALMEDLALSRALKRRGPPACLTDRVVTSGRRWQNHGALRVMLRMWSLRWRYFFGAEPRALALQYGYSPRSGAHSIVLAKAPIAGYAKTRLSVALGDAGAARLQRRFILRTLRTAHSAGLGPLTLCCAPTISHRFFRLLSARFALTCIAQSEGDIGARMAAASAAHFTKHPRQPCILLGTDCPALGPGHLQALADALQTQTVALIGAEDGGYVAIGLSQHVAEIFEAMEWSTPFVLKETLMRLQTLGLPHSVVDTLWDVDTPQDFQRYQNEIQFYC